MCTLRVYESIVFESFFLMHSTLDRIYVDSNIIPKSKLKTRPA